jgi:thioesterase domain-containing protein/NAD(P)-dependent dehydrogenase (short-subunit alcohol dehydrogenase family)/acyl carrier protein
VQQNGDAAAARFDVTLVNEDGRVLVELKGFEAREAGRHATAAGALKAGTPPRARESSADDSADEETRRAETAFFAPHWARSSSTADAEQAGERAGRVLIVRPEDDLGLSSLLLKAHEGHAACEVLLGARFASLGEGRWEIDHREPSDFRRVFDPPPHFEHVYFLGGVNPRASLEPDEVERAQQLSALSLFRLAQALGGAWGRQRRSRLTVITNDVHQVLPEDSIRPHAASAIGLAKVIAREYPHLEVSCVDVSTRDLEAADAAVLEDLARALAAEGVPASGAEVGIRRGERYEKRYRRIALPQAAGEGLPLRRKGVYLVVGGAGGIGREVCRFLAERAGARLAVIGRGRPDAAKEEMLAELRAAGAAEAVYLRADVTSLEETRAALADLSARWGEVNGVVHSAMVLADGTLAGMSEEGFRAAFDVKVKGACVLAKALAEFSPDWLALFSSTISWTANAGQCNYVAASAFEDAFGLRLRQEGKYDVKILNWGYWGGVGAVAGAKYRERAARLGVGSIDAAEGLDAFARVLAGGEPQVFVLKATPEVFTRLGVGPDAAPVDLTPRTKAAAAPLDSEPYAGAAEGDEELLGGTKLYLRGVFSEVLKAAEDEIEENVPFENYGIDSLVAIDIMQRLEGDLGLLPHTLLFDEPTLERLARHLVTNVPTETMRRLAAGRNGGGGGDGAHADGKRPRGAAEPAPLIVQVKRGGGARASFWVHGALGEISWVLRLARRMSDECPVYALQARGLDGRAEPFESIEEMAAAYVEAIQEVAPRGPYVLGGYSLGGAVALEMAHQFERRGEAVSRLILLDAYAPGSRAMRSLTTFEDDDFVLLAVTNLLALQWGATEFLSAAMLPAGDLRRKTEFAAARLFANSAQPYGLTDLVAHLRRFVEVAHRHAELLTRYEARPRRAPVETTLFRAALGFSAGGGALGLPRVEVAGGEPDLGWGGLLPSPPEIRDVDADHFSLSAEPAVSAVAQHLSRLFEGDAAGAPRRDTSDGPRARPEIFEVIREQVLRVLVDVPAEAVTPEVSLRALGANSIDRVEVVTLSMEALDANVPRARLGGVNNLRELVEVFYTHLSAT